MKRNAIRRILVAIDEEIGAADRAGDRERLLAAMAAHRAVGKLRVDGVDLGRMRRFNGTVGAFGYVTAAGPTGAQHHPDRCTCQGTDSTPHKHYDEAPHVCARCLNCKGYEPAVPAAVEGKATGYTCQFCGHVAPAREWKRSGDKCPNCHRLYDAQLAQDCP